MTDPTRLSSRDELVAYMESGNKPKADWRIGTEHEKFGFHRDTFAPLAYDERGGIREILEGLAGFGWEPGYENGLPIALKKDGASITLEPGGQLELSGAPLENIHQTCNEVHTHLDQLQQVADPLNVGFLGMGFNPKWGRNDMPWMPKARYIIMREYMPKRGTLGLDMMVRTCTVQVNLDFSSEADMVHKFRTSLALQPIATALFANSPFTQGQPNGFLSYRSHIWTDTDPDRCGMLDWVFDSGMGFERYTDYMLDVPMYFVYRDGKYLDASGLSFRDFLKGELATVPGELPTLQDWEDHLTTAFPEVRLKRFLEMRGADGGPWRRLCALPALWVGLLYDDAALDAAWDLVKDWTQEERNHLRDEVPKHGFRTKIRGQELLTVAREVLEIAHAGLARRAAMDGAGNNECGFLNTLQEVVDKGVTPAERKLALFDTEWNGSIDEVYKQCAY